jgi:hypothetical protein
MAMIRVGKSGKKVVNTDHIIKVDLEYAHNDILAVCVFLSDNNTLIFEGQEADVLREYFGDEGNVEILLTVSEKQIPPQDCRAAVVQRKPRTGAY